jgi:cytochrome c oxidase accessory protein FixG
MSVNAPLSPKDHAPVVETSDVQAVGSVAYRKLYKKREPIYPKAVDGPFRKAKWAIMAVLLGIYYLLPWVRWDRGPGRPDQAFMVDFENRRFFFGPIELWPQEVVFITGLMIAAALGLFLVTALFGRVWCGYTCPQTVWTDLFLFVERRIEGDRSAQIRLAKAPWSLEKIGKKLAKHSLWILIAVATGGAWVFYFGDAPTLLREIFTGRASPAIYGFIALFTFTTYALAGTMREQVCTYLCPWPRIQAAMIDKESLTVAYRSDRGEPRAPHKKGTSWDGRGDCIDCNQCVAACPQGIDIRDGYQLECINCALCIDACDAVMEKVGRPKGLIAYDNDLNIARRAAKEKPQLHFVRPRTIVYTVVLAIIGSIMTYALITRRTMELNVIRDRNPAYVRLADGAVRNGYSLKILNMRPVDRVMRVHVEGVDGAVLTSVGHETKDGVVEIAAPGDGVTELRLYVAAKGAALTAPNQTLTIVATDASGAYTLRANTAFLTGVK